MKLIFAIATIGVFCAAEAPAHVTRDVVIKDVTVVDTRDGALQGGLDVVIRGDRIAQIEKTGAPHSGAAVLDGRGKFLIPGLWDIAVHLSWTTASALPILVANGVTGVRDMGGNLLQIEDWRTKIATGQLTGPQILTVGPMLNGQSFNPLQMPVGPPDQARGAVRTLKFIGVDGLNLERRVPRDSYFALMDEAKADGTPVGGHIPITVTAEEVSNAGQTSIENIETLYDGTFAAGIAQPQMPDAIEKFLASGEADKLFATFAKNHTAVTPAIATLGSILQSAAHPDPRLRYVAKSLRDFGQKHPLSADDVAGLQKMYPKLMKTVAQMNRDGVTLLAGTDIAGPRVPGFSLHDELATLVKSGLTPLQALQAATLNPAIVLKRTQDMGTVEPGKFADLVLLDGNPLTDEANLDRIAAVVQRGHLYRRADLDALLKEGEREADRN